MSELYDGFGNKTELSKDVSRLKDDLAIKQNRVINLFDKTDSDILDGYYIGSDGNPIKMSNFSETGYIPCTLGCFIRLQSNGSFITSNSTIIAFYDSDKNFLKTITTKIPFEVNEPNCAFVRIPFRSNIKNYLIVTVNDETLYSKYIQFGNSANMIINELNEIKLSESNIINCINPNKFDIDDLDVLRGKYLDDNGEEVVLDSFFETGYIPCKTGDVIRGYNNSGIIKFSGQPICYYDNNKNFISSRRISGESYIIGETNISYIRIPWKLSDISSFMITLNDDYLYPFYMPHNKVTEKIFDLLSDINEKVETSLWSGVSCVTLGSSIMYNDGRTVNGEVRKGYPSYLRSIGMTVTNKGVSGACVALETTKTYVDNCETVDTIDFSNYDFVLLEGGINDYLNSVHIGDFADSDFNKSEFTQAYQYIIEKILADNPTIQIVMMTPIQTTYKFSGNANNVGNYEIDYVNRIKEIASRYSIPMIDLYNLGGLNKYNLSTYTDDNLHPNNAGYKRLNNIVIPFIKNLITDTI